MGNETRGYQYDVFLSYSRSQAWPSWIKEHFRPIIEHWLTSELGRDVRIFQDEQIKYGEQWSEELERALAASRVMIALWSRNYFQSEWCKRELGILLARAEYLRSLGLSDQVVFPIAIHDSEPTSLPELARSLKMATLHDLADPFIHPGSAVRELLSRKLRSVSEDVAGGIRATAPETYSWPLAAYADFEMRLAVEPGTPSFPSLGG